MNTVYRKKLKIFNYKNQFDNENNEFDIFKSEIILAALRII